MVTWAWLAHLSSCLAKFSKIKNRPLQNLVGSWVLQKYCFHSFQRAESEACQCFTEQLWIISLSTVWSRKHFLAPDAFCSFFFLPLFFLSNVSCCSGEMQLKGVSWPWKLNMPGQAGTENSHHCLDPSPSHPHMSCVTSYNFLLLEKLELKGKEICIAKMPLLRHISFPSLPFLVEVLGWPWKAYYFSNNNGHSWDCSNSEEKWKQAHSTGLPFFPPPKNVNGFGVSRKRRAPAQSEVSEAMAAWLVLVSGQINWDISTSHSTTTSLPHEWIWKGCRWGFGTPVALRRP